MRPVVKHRRGKVLLNWLELDPIEASALAMDLHNAAKVASEYQTTQDRIYNDLRRSLSDLPIPSGLVVPDGHDESGA